ncbi:MAG: hypothetical protein ACRCTY_04155 [Candidatus Adiutrix sp.]
MKRIFISSSDTSCYEEEKQGNIALAKELCRKVLADGHAPFSPYLFASTCVDVSNSAEMFDWVTCSLKFMNACDELLFVRGKGGDSLSMEVHHRHAVKIGMPIKYLHFSEVKNV